MDRFKDRYDAGRRLADALAGYRGSDALVLALPRGGVPVGHEVARALGLPLDVLIVRKLGAPGQPELAMGAVAQGGARYRNEEVVRGLGVTDERFETAAQAQELEVRQRLHHFRGDRPLPAVQGRSVILVDDGVATGSTIMAAAKALRTLAPTEVVMAVPVVSPSAKQRLAPYADRFVAVLVPPELQAVGQWYDDFSQTPDAEVVRLLEAAHGATVP